MLSGEVRDKEKQSARDKQDQRWDTPRWECDM